MEAKEIIVEKLGGSESIEDMYIVSEFDDFIKVYDASVICDDGMYEFEILARNGKLLSFEYSGQELPDYVNQYNGLHLKD